MRRRQLAVESKQVVEEGYLANHYLDEADYDRAERDDDYLDHNDDVLDLMCRYKMVADLNKKAVVAKARYYNVGDRNIH